MWLLFWHSFWQLAFSLACAQAQACSNASPACDRVWCPQPRQAGRGVDEEKEEKKEEKELRLCKSRDPYLAGGEERNQSKKNGRGSKTSQRPLCHKEAARGTRCRRCRDQENPAACIGSRPEAGQVGNGGAASSGGAIARCEMLELELELQEEKGQHGLEAEAPEVTTSSSQSPPFA